MSQYLASLACVQQLILHFSTDKMASNLGIVDSYPSDRDGTKAMHYLPSGPPVSKWKQNDSHAVYQTMLCSWRTELHGRRYDLFEQFVNCFDRRATSSCHLLQRSRLTVSVSHDWMEMRVLGPGEKLILFCPICAFSDVCRGSRGANSCEPKEHHVHPHREAIYHGQSLQDHGRRLSVRPVFGRDRDPCYWRGENSQTCHDKPALLNE